MENTEKKTYSVEEIRKGADWISSSCPKQAEMLRQFAEMLERCEKMIKGHDDLIAHYTSIGCNRGIDINRMLKHELERVLNGQLTEKGKKRYVVTRVDGDYCPVCEIFDTWESAEEFVKADFEKCGCNWDHRFSMTDAKSFPFRESEDGNHEWDIHEKEIA